MYNGLIPLWFLYPMKYFNKRFLPHESSSDIDILFTSLLSTSIFRCLWKVFLLIPSLPKIKILSFIFYFLYYVKKSIKVFHINYLLHDCFFGIFLIFAYSLQAYFYI